MSPRQLDNNVQTTWAIPNMQAHKFAVLIKKIFFVFHMCPQYERAGRRLRHGFHSPARDALSFLRYTCRHRVLNRAPGFHMCQMLPFFFFSPSGAEGSQGALFCREGRWEQAEVSEWETQKQKKTLPESEHFFSRWEQGRAGTSWWNYDEEQIQQTDKGDTSHMRTKLSQVFSGVEGSSWGILTGFATKWVEPWLKKGLYGAFPLYFHGVKPKMFPRRDGDYVRLSKTRKQEIQIFVLWSYVYAADNVYIGKVILLRKQKHISGQMQVL